MADSAAFLAGLPDQGSRHLHRRRHQQAVLGSLQGGGRLDLFADPRFNTTAGRIENRLALLSLLDEVFKTRTQLQWLELLEAADISVGPVNELADVFDNPQIQHRKMLVETEHALAGTIRLLANPMRLSKTPVTDYPAPPLLGQHTREVLATVLGLDAAQLDNLAQKHVI